MTYKYAELAGKVLAREDAGRADSSPGNREAGVEAVGRALLARSRTVRRRAIVVRVGSIAAAAALVLLGYRIATHRAGGLPSSTPAAVAIYAYPVGEGAVVTGNNAPAHALALGEPLPYASRVLAGPQASVDLSLSTGTQIAVERGGDLTVLTEMVTQRFKLGTGTMRAEVAKLAAGQRFVIETPDSEVEVRGTSFRVTVAPDGATCQGLRTRVEVASGTVAVHSGGGEMLVGAGETWPAGCPATAPATAPETPASEASEPAAHAEPRAEPRAVHATAPAPAAPAPPPPSSKLGEVNELFAKAMAAKHGGQPAEALELLRRIQSQFSSSPLAESAMVEEIRLMKGMDPARAKAIASRYLDTYPRGFASAEARALASGSR